MYPSLDPPSLDGVRDTYERFYDSYVAELGHYFRNLYRIVKFVHERAPDNDKRLYMGILRAQLSSAELACLFYNGVSVHGAEKFKPLIEQYALLENIPRSALADERHARFYSQRAFGDAQWALAAPSPMSSPG